MLKLSLFNEKYLLEIKELFEEVKQYFPHYSDVAEFIKDCQGHFYIGTFNDEFIGCLFLDKWAENSVYIGGFSKRKNKHTMQGFKLLTHFTFEDYPHIKTIYADTDKKNKHVQFFLKRAGFVFDKEINNKYLYKQERVLNNEQR